MKTIWRRTANLILGLLLLISVLYSIPSAPRQKTISQTEWVKTLKKDDKENKVFSKIPKSFSFEPLKFAHQFFNFDSRIKTRFRLSRHLQFTCIVAKFIPAKIFSDDDYYYSPK